eukprot:scaffold674_cov126-Cylindrotheca_fusiformis.AAC.12
MSGRSSLTICFRDYCAAASVVPIGCTRERVIQATSLAVNRPSAHQHPVFTTAFRPKAYRAGTTTMSLLFSNLSRILVRPVVSSVGIHQPSYLMTALRFKGGVKTVSGVKKRFRLRGSGSIKRYVFFWGGAEGMNHTEIHLCSRVFDLLGLTSLFFFFFVPSFCLDDDRELPIILDTSNANDRID